MSRYDDRPDRDADLAVDALLAGREPDDEWRALTAFAADVRTATEGPVPPPSPALASLMIGDADPPAGTGAQRTGPHRPTPVGVAVRVALGAVLAGTGVAAAGGAGILPAPVERTMRPIIEFVTPFDLDGRAPDAGGRDGGRHPATPPGDVPPSGIGASPPPGSPAPSAPTTPASPAPSRPTTTDGSVSAPRHAPSPSGLGSPPTVGGDPDPAAAPAASPPRAHPPAPVPGRAGPPASPLAGPPPGAPPGTHDGSGERGATAGQPGLGGLPGNACPPPGPPGPPDAGNRNPGPPPGPPEPPSRGGGNPGPPGPSDAGGGNPGPPGPARSGGNPGPPGPARSGGGGDRGAAPAGPGAAAPP